MVLGGLVGGEAVVFVVAFDDVEGDGGAVAAAELVVTWGDEGVFVSARERCHVVLVVQHEVVH